ncbi:MAG: rhomboid family intramembrane serine protease [Verrucomicrobia bacterium]|nr:rhomboid family intramembrane serine protease [Verrucomicrobiota bacterium]
MLPLWDDAPRRRPAVVTAMLIAANLGVFIYEGVLASQGGRALPSFLIEHSLVPQRLLGGLADGQQWLTIFTAMFLHGGVAHVAGNCWFLWIFGKNVEDRLGPVRYILFYLFSGLGAAALQVAMDTGSTLPMLGASGAISGVLGAYLALFPTAWIFTLVPWVVPIVPLPAFVLLIVWFGLQALNGVGSLMNDEMARGGVAWWAHAGGFLTGLIVTIMLRRKGWIKRR